MNAATKEPEKKESWRLFNQISGTYDKINRILSLNLDQSWRKSLSKHLPERSNIVLLDGATGTADQIILLMEESKRIRRAVGIDLAENMLSIGKDKIKRKRFGKNIHLSRGDITAIAHDDASFDCVTLSFGIRNVENISLALREIHRVLKKDGRALILEFSIPKNRLFRPFYLFYLRHILPKLGRLLSRDAGAYAYLNTTIKTFPSPHAFSCLLVEAGFSSVKTYPMTFGIVTLYVADK